MSEARYPEDEFDRIGKNLPQGAHRPGQPWWHGFLPFVIVIIIAPLLAWAMLLLLGSHPLSNNADSPKSTETATTQEAPHTEPTTGPEPSESATGGTMESNSPEPSETAEPPKEADKTTAVSVFNASGINGLAAGVKEKITAKGFTNVNATNFSGTKPAVNTIYYPTDLEAEAREVQRILGIDMIVPRDGVEGVQVVLVGRL